MRHLFEFAGLVVEPSGALGIAAILEDRERFQGRTVATIVCGSNITSSDFRRWVLDAPLSSARPTTDIATDIELPRS